MKAFKNLRVICGIACVGVATQITWAQESNIASATPSDSSRHGRSVAERKNPNLGPALHNALSQVPGLDVSGINVKVRGQVVTLAGDVAQPGQITLAGAAVQGVAGVSTVHNLLIASPR
ncbi:BON domain-containing protein [Burkholderia sp. 22PA0099]|uniref:BON domain-containing protein n=1 Tax=Burkholderia sp. 22PA0099 TaxID=3237372 RepID=UPI0039C2407D